MSKRKSFLVLLSLLATTSIGVGSLASCDNNKKKDETVEPQKNYYNINLTESADYTLKSNVEKAAEGDQVEISVEIKNKEKVLINLESDGVTFTKVEDNKYTFIMPGSHVTIKALLEDKTYKIETEITGSNCTLKTNKENNLAKAGELITVTISSLEAGYMVTNVSIKEEGSTNWQPAVKVDESNYTFMMPAKNVKVMAETEKVDFNITLLSTNEEKVTLKAFKDDAEISKAQVGDLVKIEPQILDEEWEVTKITVAYDETEKEVSPENGKYSFLMEAKAVTVKVYAAIKEAKISLTGENLADIEVTKIEEIKGNDVVNTIKTNFESITSVVGRKLRIYAKAKHTPAHVNITGLKFNDANIALDETNTYFETPVLEKANTMSFTTDPVAQHKITVSNPNNLYLCAFINNTKKAIPETVYDGQELKLQIKNSNAYDILNLETSGIFKTDGTKLCSFKEVDPVEETKVFETDLFAINSDIEIRIETSNKLLNRKYKTLASDAMSGTEYEIYIELLVGNKIHFLIQQNYYGLTKFIDEDIQCESLANGNLGFEVKVNGTTNHMKVSFTEYEAKFVEGYVGGIKLNLTGNPAKLTYFDETLTSTSAEDTNKLVVSKDGTATYGNITGSYTITSDFDGWYLNIGEEKFVLSLETSTFTYVPKVSPIESYFFTGKTFKSTYNTPYDEWGNGGEQYEMSLVFGTADDGLIIKSLLYKENGQIYINETDIAYTVSEGKTSNILNINFQLDGTLVELNAYKNNENIRFSDPVTYKGKDCYLNIFVYIDSVK